MKEFKCPKCGSNDIFVEGSGQQVGLYCSDCGVLIKLLSKKEIRQAEKQIERLNYSIGEHTNEDY